MADSLTVSPSHFFASRVPPPKHRMNVKSPIIVTSISAPASLQRLRPRQASFPSISDKSLVNFVVLNAPSSEERCYSTLARQKLKHGTRTDV